MRNRDTDSKNSTKKGCVSSQEFESIDKQRKKEQLTFEHQNIPSLFFPHPLTSHHYSSVPRGELSRFIRYAPLLPQSLVLGSSRQPKSNRIARRSSRTALGQGSFDWRWEVAKRRSPTRESSERRVGLRWKSHWVAGPKLKASMASFKRIWRPWFNDFISDFMSFSCSVRRGVEVREC